MGKPIYRMSSAGKCPRALSAERQGYEPEPAPKWLEQAANEGNWHEMRIKTELREGGNLVIDEQLEVRLEYPDFILLGHIDGKAADTLTATKLLEVKSMSQFEFDRWMKGRFEKFPEYADQLTCYMEATGLGEALYIVKNRSSGYVDRQVLVQQPSDMRAIEGKFAAIEDWLGRNVKAGAREGVYPAEFDPNSLECCRCNFKYLCIVSKEEMTRATEAELTEAARQIREGKRLAAEAEGLLSEGKRIFMEHTVATGIDKWQFNDLVIILVKVKEKLDYPKSKLLEVFTEEQLKPASVIKLPYEYVRIDDLRKEQG